MPRYQRCRKARSPLHGGVDRNNVALGKANRAFVAPSRGRGSKHNCNCVAIFKCSRPFTGAWIETLNQYGAKVGLDVAPSRGRGSNLDGFTARANMGVAPSRGRGSKQAMRLPLQYSPQSPLHGGVDRNLLLRLASRTAARRPFTGAWIETTYGAMKK